jgi:HD-GYP domain-containing protein (c-di-GMP phosphodiesterase class II)
MDIKNTPESIETVQPRVFSNDENLNTLLNSVVNDVTSHAERLFEQIKKLSDIGIALSGVYDLNTLLEMIVDSARNFTNADAGTLYIVEENTLRFKIVQNDSLKIRMGGKDGEPIPFAPVELNQSNVSAYVALNGVSVNIPDVYNTNLFDFTGPKKFDQSTGYRSQSMLVVPMRDHYGDVIGVLQLLNATTFNTGQVTTFSQDYENLTESLASQAAVSITNAKLISNMAELFEAFVKVMATAIDEKSPVTGGHIRRVADLTLTMADVIHNIKEGPYKEVTFTQDQIYELKIAAYMHDIGKVTSPVEIVEKAKKLQTIFDRIQYIRLRMAYISQRIILEGQNAKIEILQNGSDSEKLKALETETHNKLEEIKEIREFINKCNEPGEFLDDETLERLKEISQKTYIDDEEKQQPFLKDDELVNLSIRRGSITEVERKKMQDHAAVTLRMLKQIPFTKKLKNIPGFAGAHHEFINGKGYPLGLKGDEIPFEGKLMAVTDIAEALTASDRPYKKAMPLETVNRILRSMAQKEELDNNLVELFIEKEVYKTYQEKYENSNGDK